MLKRSVAVLGIVIIVFAASLASFGQATPATSAQVQQATATALDQALTYIDSTATYVGQGVLYVLNLITNDRVSSDLQKPIGYLALITLILILFGLLDFARRVIWIGIIVGWVLLIVRIILDALNL